MSSRLFSRGSGRWPCVVMVTVGAGVRGIPSAPAFPGAVANASAAASSAMSSHRNAWSGRPLAPTPRGEQVIASRTSPNSRERPHLDLPIASLTPGGELERDVEVGPREPEAGGVLRLQEGPVGERRAASVVDDGRAGSRPPAKTQCPCASNRSLNALMAAISSEVPSWSCRRSRKPGRSRSSPVVQGRPRWRRWVV